MKRHQESNQKRISVCIQSMNRRKLLFHSIQSILAASANIPHHLDIFVYDAGSTDGSREYINSINGNSKNTLIHLIQSPHGLSFSKGSNVLVSEAIKLSNPDYIFLFETDNLLFGANALLYAVGFLEGNTDASAVGFTVIKRSGQRADWGCEFPGQLGFVLGQRLSAAILREDGKRASFIYSGPRVWEVDVAYTSPLLIRRNAWEAAGGFDAKRFPFTDSDLDLCHRLRSTWGFVGVLETDEIVHNNCGNTSGWSDTRVYRWHSSRYKYLDLHTGEIGWMTKIGLVVRHTLEIWALGILVGIGRRPPKALRLRLRLLRCCWQGYPIQD